MPEMMATFSGSTRKAESALVIDPSTLKSPQPGHQTGLTPDL
jgi:hypothetical protein